MKSEYSEIYFLLSIKQKEILLNIFIDNRKRYPQKQIPPNDKNTDHKCESLKRPPSVHTSMVNQNTKRQKDKNIKRQKITFDNITI